MSSGTFHISRFIKLKTRIARVDHFSFIGAVFCRYYEKTSKYFKIYHSKSKIIFMYKLKRTLIFAFMLSNIFYNIALCPYVPTCADCRLCTCNARCCGSRQCPPGLIPGFGFFMVDVKCSMTTVSTGL